MTDHSNRRDFLKLGVGLALWPSMGWFASAKAPKLLLPQSLLVADGVLRLSPNTKWGEIVVRDGGRLIVGKGCEIDTLTVYSGATIDMTAGGRLTTCILAATESTEESLQSAMAGLGQLMGMSE